MGGAGKAWLSAAAEDYERLAARDAADAGEALAEGRDAIAECVDGCGGHVLGDDGERVTAELPGALEAARCALAIQEELDRLNAARPLDRILAFRTGVAVEDAGLAGLLAGLAPPGGICVSGAVHEQVKAVLAARFDDMGERELPGLPAPLPVWQMQRSETRAARPAGARRGRRLARPAALAVLLAAAAGAAFLYFGQGEPAATAPAAGIDVAQVLRALGADPGSAGARERRAIELLLAGASGDALTEASRALRDAPRQPLPVLLIGIAHAASDEPAAALAAFEATLDRSPELPGARVWRIAARTRVGDDARARAEADALVIARPEFDSARFAASMPLSSAAERERLVAALRSAGLR